MDSAARIVTCMQRAATDTGNPIPPPAAIRHIIGLGMHEAIAILFPNMDNDDANALIAAYRAHWLSDNIAPSSLFPGAEQMLRTLAEAGYLLAVATGKSRRGLNKILDETRLGHLFDMTRCADETRSKPDPQMVHDILIDLNTEPANAIVIGDTEYDMQMAGNARVDAAGVAHGVHGVQQLQQHGALHIFTNLDEIPGWLKNTS